MLLLFFFYFAPDHPFGHPCPIGYCWRSTVKIPFRALKTVFRSDLRLPRSVCCYNIIRSGYDRIGSKMRYVSQKLYYSVAATCYTHRCAVVWWLNWLSHNANGVELDIKMCKKNSTTKFAIISAHADDF